MGDVIAATLPLAELQELERNHRNIREFIEWRTQREINALQDQLVWQSGASVEDKLIFLLTDLQNRLRATSEGENKILTLPLRQADFADAIGASIVQVNKVLSKLRSKGRLHISRQRSRLSVALNDDDGVILREA